MRPVGYSTKLVVKPETWLDNDSVEEILSVSECLSASPIDHYALWMCNAWALYDSVEALDAALARTEVEDGGSLRRFFYEAHPEILDEGRWEPLVEAPVGVRGPTASFALMGYDVVGLDDSGPNCSPLSCNGGAKHFEVNRHCLLGSIDEALEVVRRIDTDGGYEPGPYGVLSVWEEGR